MKKHREGWGCVYSAINRYNNLEYIGKDRTGDPENHRWKCHITAAAKPNPIGYFQRGIRGMGGPQYFTWSVIWRGPLDRMIEKEIYYIARRHTFVGDPKCRGYNLTKGGDGVLGFKHSSNTKKKLSAISKITNLRRYKDPAEHEKSSVGQRRRRANPEDRKKTSVAGKRRFENPAEREKQRAAQLHRWEDQSEHEKASEAHLYSWAQMGSKRRKKHAKAVSVGKTLQYKNSDEREKMSIAALRRYKDPAEHEKSRAAQMQPKTRKKQAKASKRRWKKPEAHKLQSEAMKRGWVTRRINAAKKGRQSEAK